MNLFLYTPVNAQEKFTLSGKITEASSNESLISVNVIIPELTTGAVTNEYGFYSITLPKGNYKVIVSYLGFSEITETITLNSNITKNFSLEESFENLDEVIITENVEKLNIKKPQMSVNALKSSTINQIPVVLGEADVIKAILLLPGVTNAGGGA